MSDSRCYLYRKDAPKGRIFVGEKAIEEALDDGWVDSPTAIVDKAPAKVDKEAEAAKAEKEAEAAKKKSATKGGNK